MARLSRAARRRVCRGRRRGSADIDIDYDVTRLSLGVYEGKLCLAIDDSHIALIHATVTLTVTTTASTGTFVGGVELR